MMAACGVENTLAVTHDGALWACGIHFYPEIKCTEGGGWVDSGKHVISNSFERVGAGGFGGARIVATAVGALCAVAVTEDGALWTWGSGYDGQLGHGDGADRVVPTLVAGTGLGGRRIGRCRGLPAEHALAFAMGTHGRLGASSPVRCLAGEVGLLRMILGWYQGWRWMAGAAGREEGVVRLLVGGQVLESVMGLSGFPLDAVFAVGERVLRAVFNDDDAIVSYDVATVVSSSSVKDGRKWLTMYTIDLVKGGRVENVHERDLWSPERR